MSKISKNDVKDHRFGGNIYITCHTSPLPAIFTVSVTALSTSPQNRPNSPASIPPNRRRTSSAFVTAADPAEVPRDVIALLRLLTKKLTSGNTTNIRNTVAIRLVLR